MSDIRSNTVDGVKWSAIEKFSVQGIMFLVSLVLARLLTPSDFGLVGMLSIFIAISQTFIDSGFSSALIRKADRTEIDNSTAFYFNIIVGLISYLALYVVAPYIADFYNTPVLKDITRVLGITLFLNSLTVVQVALLTINVDFKTQAKVNFTSAILSGIIGILMAYNGWGVWALVYQQVIRSALCVLFLWIATKWKPLFVFSWVSFKNLFSFGSKILMSGLLHTVYLNVANLVIGKFYTSKDLGFYERGQQFGRVPIDSMVMIFQRVTYPIMSSIQEDEQRLIYVYRKYIKMTSIIIFFVIFLLIALAKPIILVLLTEKWSEAIIFLQLYCFANMFNHITRINLNLLQVKGRSDLFLRLEVIKKSISLLFLILSIPYGVIAICLSQVAYVPFALYLNTYYTNKLFGISLMSQVRDFAKYMIAALAACLPVYLCVLFNLSNLICLLIGPLIAIVLYIFVLLRRDPIYCELCEIAQGYYRKR